MPAIAKHVKLIFKINNGLQQNNMFSRNAIDYHKLAEYKK